MIDVGCGNGRIGRIIAPLSAKYYGCDLSESVYAFPSYLESTNISLIRASGTNLPFTEEALTLQLAGACFIIWTTFFWVNELLRVTKVEVKFNFHLCERV